ncbi:hypothetical protein M405DRAFT_826280 [Rhizopogon salebrosus TDB-379]|nr:hypothetical protein M405DRAFT_826280 [Rhizopogon salebrosus TDB-379]
MDLLWLAAAVIIRIPGFSVNEADELTVVLCWTFTLCYITPVVTSDIHKCAVGQTLCVPRTHWCSALVDLHRGCILTTRLF